MALASLTFKEIRARPVICKLTRPAVARIGAMTHIADHSHRPLYRRGCCRQELPQTLLAESHEVLDPGAARFWRDAQRPACFAGRSLRNGPQVASFRRLSGFVDDRRGRPRHGGLGRAGQSGGRAPVRSARRLGRARESLQQQRTVAAVAGIRGSRGGRTARREGRRIPSREASAGPRRSTRRPRGHKGGAGCDRRRYRPDGRFQPGPQSRRRLAALPHDRRSWPCLDRGTGPLRRFRQLPPGSPPI